MKNIFIIAFIFSLSFISFSLCSAKPHSKSSAEQSTSNMVGYFGVFLDKLLPAQEEGLADRGFSTTRCSSSDDCLEGQKCLEAKSVLSDLMTPDISERFSLHLCELLKK
ncbi:UNVERIFIED_CONTAM: hypothetical protein RMT77_004976 [Armadillidium vulgare]